MPHFHLARLDLARSAFAHVGVVEDTASGRGKQRRPAEGNANNSARAQAVVVATVLGSGGIRSRSRPRSLSQRAESDKAHILKGGYALFQGPPQLSNGNHVAVGYVQVNFWLAGARQFLVHHLLRKGNGVAPILHLLIFNHHGGFHVAHEATF